MRPGGVFNESPVLTFDVERLTGGVTAFKFYRLSTALPPLSPYPRGTGGGTASKNGVLCK